MSLRGVSHTSLDGRTATWAQTVSVRTHDVSIDRIQAPNAARTGQTKTVGVNLRGGRYPETVQVDLLRSVAGGYEQLVGSQTVAVPAARGGRLPQPTSATPSPPTTPRPARSPCVPSPPSWGPVTPCRPTTRPSPPPTDVKR